MGLIIQPTFSNAIHLLPYIPPPPSRCLGELRVRAGAGVCQLSLDVVPVRHHSSPGVRGSLCAGGGDLHNTHHLALHDGESHRGKNGAYGRLLG